ncbi:MAG: GDSL-type esterase/lipase family protein [Planctomyces sp.]
MYQRSVLRIVAVCLAVGLVLSATSDGCCAADDPPGGPLYAWYRDGGLQSVGAEVTSWNSAAAGDSGRLLDRVVGRPQLVKVQAAFGRSEVLRFNGSAALWQAAGSWGTLRDARTVVLMARLPAAGSGTLLDGSTRAGSVPVRWERGRFVSKTQPVAESVTADGAGGGWRATAFVFPAGGTPLGGLILGANVAAADGLSCDVAEVLVYPRGLSAEECRQVVDWLAAKWGQPADLPANEQPQRLTLPDEPRIFRTTIRRRGDDGVDTYRIPGLATTPRGTLIAVFDARNRSGADLPGDIDVAMQRSTDGGETWGSMQRIMDFDAAVSGSQGNGVGDPAVLVDQRTGRIFVAALWSLGPRAWHGSGPGMTAEETGQLMLVHSDDDGVTWSQPISITSQVKRPEWRLCFNGPGNGIQLRDGTLVFSAQYRDPDGKPHSCFIASVDGGSHWKISPAAIPDGVPTSESAIVELSDGALLLSMRNESRSGQRAWARWEWQGELWSGKWSDSWLDLPDPTCMASVIRHPHGELIFSNPADAKQRQRLTIRSSVDGGRKWSRGRLLDPGGAMYSCLTVLADGRIGLLYESVDAAGLVFARFPLDWVQEGASVPTVSEGRLERTGKFGWWLGRHEAKLQETRAGGVQLAFLGDSITQGWEAAGRESWQRYFGEKRAVNYGFGGDSTQHVLWRLEHGEFDGLSPEAIVLLIGTNNVRHGDFSPEEIAAGIAKIVSVLGEKCPRSRVLLLGLLPRGAEPADRLRQKCEAVNALLPNLANGERVQYLNVNSVLLEDDGRLSQAIAPDWLHLSADGYDRLGRAIAEKMKLWGTGL